MIGVDAGERRLVAADRPLGHVHADEADVALAWDVLVGDAIEPSRDFATPGAVRAVGEALPLADRSIDVAIGSRYCSWRDVLDA